MRDSDFIAFSTMLEDLAAFYPTAKAPTAGFKAMFFRALRELTADEVRAGLDAHLRDPQRGRFMPLPSDVIAQVTGLAADDGRPGAEEAWATAMRGQDQSDTIVWTAETCEAMAIATPVLDAGDEVGARMAFREAYERLVREARAVRRPAAWTPSLGFDPERRATALAAAAARGLLPSADIIALPAPRASVALLEGPQDEIPENARAALHALRNWLTSRPEETSAWELERHRTAEQKERTARLFAERMAVGDLDAHGRKIAEQDGEAA